MPRVPLNIPPGLVSDDTGFAAGGAWIDADKVRFWRGKWQVIGGWENFNGLPVTGTCRNILPWTDTSDALNVAFGTHSNLQIGASGTLYDVTPTKALPPSTRTNPLSVVSGSAVVTVKQPGHGMATGASVVVSGASAIGGITPNGTFTVTVTDVATYTYTFTSNATSTVTGGGGTVTLTPQTAFVAGNIDGLGGAGFGTGTFSGGAFSTPSTQTTFPRTWALSTYGQTLIANPRGGTVYQWSNDTSAIAVPVANAPSQIMFALVAPQRQLIAFGCNEEVSGVFNPLCIRGSDLENISDWTTSSTNNAFEVILEGGGQIVAARLAGAYIFVWTDTALYLGTYIGDPSQTWRFDRLGERCGLVGPNAVTVGGQTAFWISPDLQFHQCGLGGSPAIVASPQQAMLAKYLAASQQEKLVVSTLSQFGEVWAFYPDSRDGSENSRYISVGAISNASAVSEAQSLVQGAWSRGTLARTAFVDAGPYQYPLGVDVSGNVYLHERNHSADGAAFAWYIESGAQSLGEGDRMMQVKGLWPDFQDQMGPVSVTVYTRKYPQDTDRARGPYAMTVGQSKRDFRASGRMLRMRFSGNAAPTYARQGRLEFETEATGLQ